VYVPSNPGTFVKANSRQMRFLRDEKDSAVYEVGSGKYEFDTTF